MKLGGSCTLFIAALSSLAGTGLATSCMRQESGDFHFYTVTGPPMPDMRGICRSLDDNLSQACIVAADYCGGSGPDAHLVWEITTDCSGGMVETAWLAATGNQWGEIHCP